MKILAKMYFALGANKSQRFFRFLLLVITVGIISMLIINVGYDKSKGGIYWKPFDISVELKK
jgi:alpha-N-acetylglucosamine transferase